MPTQSLSSIAVDLNLQTVVVDEPTGISPETWQTWVKTWLDTLAVALPPAIGYELTLRLSDDQEMATLNRQFRQQDQSTDVLSFAALESELPDYRSLMTDELDLEPLYLGDIIISVATAARQAQERNHSLITELAWLAAHGLLHLLGWDHPDEDSLQAMFTQQTELLDQIGISAPVAP